jgi:hypothetical protein
MRPPERPVMIPIYAVASLASLWSLQAAFFIDAVRDVYEVRPLVARPAPPPFASIIAIQVGLLAANRSLAGQTTTRLATQQRLAAEARARSK